MTKSQELRTKLMRLEEEKKHVQTPSANERKFEEIAEPARVSNANPPNWSEYLLAAKADRRRIALANKRYQKKTALVRRIEQTKKKIKRYEDLENKFVIRSMLRQKANVEIPQVSQNIYEFYSKYNNPT